MYRIELLTQTNKDEIMKMCMVLYWGLEIVSIIDQSVVISSCECKDVFIDILSVVDQVTRQVAQCKCAKRFQVEQIGENKYRVSSAQTLAHFNTDIIYTL